MTSGSDVLVYELTTHTNAAAKASVGAVVLAVLDRRPMANLYRWTVAATIEQGLTFRGLPWVVTPRQRGVMVLTDDRLEFRDPESGDFWTISSEDLKR